MEIGVTPVGYSNQTGPAETVDQAGWEL